MIKLSMEILIFLKVFVWNANFEKDYYPQCEILGIEPILCGIYILYHTT
jgi:hypothetical protein